MGYEGVYRRRPGNAGTDHSMVCLYRYHEKEIFGGRFTAQKAQPNSISHSRLLITKPVRDAATKRDTAHFEPFREPGFQANTAYRSDHPGYAKSFEISDSLRLQG